MARGLRRLPHRPPGASIEAEAIGSALGRFPRAAHFDGNMAEIAFRPSPQLWVLEIHIRHPQQTFGAYFEDLLLPDPD